MEEYGVLKKGWKNIIGICRKEYRGIPFVPGPCKTEVTENVRPIQEIPGQEKIQGSVAVQLHLFYEDLLEEFKWYLKQIPFPFDLFVSCQENADIHRIKKVLSKLSHVGKVEVRQIPNRGRDIAPVYIWFRRELQSYDYFLHIHSKKSLFTGKEQTDWRRQSLNALLGSPNMVKRILYLLEQEEDIGLVFPEYFKELTMYHSSWLTNEMQGRAFMEEYGLHMEGSLFQYPVGSFYWAKTKALQPLFDRAYTIEEFPREEGQVDGTLLHVIERGIGVMAGSGGCRSVLVDTDEGVFRFRKSVKLFRDYLSGDCRTLQEKLSSYQTVCFDLFGTLVTEAQWEENIFPRYEIRKIVECLLNRGKTVICRIPAGYSGQKAEEILERCGYCAGKIILVPEEIGREIPSALPADSIYVTDRTFRYWEAVYGKGQETVWLMNPKDAYVLSDDYDKYKEMWDIPEKRRKLEERINGCWYNSPFALEGPEGMTGKEVEHDYMPD